MVRRGQWKYIYVHGVDAQLFDLEADPGEWHNLASLPPANARARTSSIVGRGGVQRALFDRFDPDAIEQDVRKSLRARLVIREAMIRNGTMWDYRPDFDPNRDALQQYLPPANPRCASLQ